MIYLFLSSLLVVSQAFDVISKHGCNETKGCLFEPHGCDPSINCTYALTYEPVGDRVNFEISAMVPVSVLNSGRFGRYIAVGFSNDSKIGDDPLTLCLYSTVLNQWKAFINLGYFYRGKVPSFITDKKANSGLKEMESGIVKNQLVCRFSQKIEPLTVDPRVRNLNSSYHIFMISHNADPQNLIPISADNEESSLMSEMVSKNRVNVATMSETIATDSSTISTFSALSVVVSILLALLL